MRRARVFQNTDQLQDLIHTLAQKLGPDHERVRHLKADLSRILGPDTASPRPLSPQSSDDLNKKIEAVRGALEAAKQAEANAAHAKRKEIAAVLAAVNAAVAGLPKQREK